jgi:hypothetical protein
MDPPHPNFLRVKQQNEGLRHFRPLGGWGGVPACPTASPGPIPPSLVTCYSVSSAAIAYILGTSVSSLTITRPIFPETAHATQDRVVLEEGLHLYTDGSGIDHTVGAAVHCLETSAFFSCFSFFFFFFFSPDSYPRPKINEKHHKMLKLNF